MAASKDATVSLGKNRRYIGKSQPNGRLKGRNGISWQEQTLHR
jgi:hypothetical protein